METGMNPIETYSGRLLRVDSIGPSDLCIFDIAHALARLCRFNGHITAEHYSVAEHCVLVSHLIETPEYQLAGLLHDAAEAYIGDIPSPLKAELPLVKEWEDRILGAVDARFGVDTRHHVVEEADRDAFDCEFAMFKREGGFYEWDLCGQDLTPQGWPAATAERAFLRRFRELWVPSLVGV